MLYRPFFYWVHKALPLVYDDSLSYMELLSKVLKYLNDTIIRTNENSKAIGQLADIVSSYLGSPEFTAELERILDEMAEDGTLDSIVNDPKMFVPNQMRRSSYAQKVLECAASYMYYASDCSSIVKASAPASTYKPVYNTTGKNWQSLLGKDAIYVNNFDYDDTMDGKPVMYQNCSGFVTLLTMARDYLNSPYAAAWAGNTDDLISYCKELGTIYEYPYTMDFLHWQHTYSMFFIMESSGCNPNVMYNKNGGWVDTVVNNAKSGDILFDSLSDNSYYEGIHHCMIYLKSLDDINNAAGQYGTFHALNYAGFDDNTEYGYVVHCGYGVDPATGVRSPDGPNVFRIDTLYHYVKNTESLHSDADHVLYICKPYANTLNSSKRKRVFDGTTVSRDKVMWGDRGQNSFPSTNYFVPATNYWHIGNIGISGRGITSSNAVDLDDVDGGFYYWSTENKGYVDNKPSDNAGAVVQFGDSDGRAVQIAFMGTATMYYRIKWGGWQTWQSVTHEAVVVE